MKLALGGFAFLCLFYASPVAAQALTLDQLFWLRERPSLDDAEYLEIEHGWRWQSAKDVTLNDSAYYSTNWVFRDAHKKRVATLVYESRRNVASITYSTSNRLIFNALKAGVAAYHMQPVGQRRNNGVTWSYFRYEEAYDVSLASYSASKAAQPTWYTIVVRPRWR